MGFTREEKLLWGEGPWVDEPDELMFEYKDISCFIERKYHGALCGYIFLPVKHKYAKYRRWEKLSVHGGVTYSETAITRDNFLNENMPGKKVFIIGFDCAHSPDFIPRFNYAEREIEKIIPTMREINKRLINVGRNPYGDPKKYKDIEFVKNELQQLVDQVLSNP